MARKSAQSVQLKLRFSETLRLRIEAAAKKNARSMNSEIVQRLELSFHLDDRDDLVRKSAIETARTILEKFSHDPGMTKALQQQLHRPEILAILRSIHGSSGKNPKVSRVRKGKP